MSKKKNKKKVSKRENTKKEVKNVFGIIVGSLLIILTLAIITLVMLLNVLNGKLFWLMAIGLSFIAVLISTLLFIKPVKKKQMSKKKKKRLKTYYVFRGIAFFFAIILIIGYCFIVHYLNKTLNFIDNISVIKEEVTDYYIVVLKDSKYQESSDLEGDSLGYFSNMDNNVLSYIKLELDKKSTNDLAELKNWLYNGDVSSIFISDVIKDHYIEENENFENEVRILNTISIKEEAKDITKRVSMKNTPFNVLISGIDTFGKINKKSRNDVNIIATVNPNTNKILLTSIPRDYYVQLRGKTGLKDKLTHASYYGMDCAIGTIEDILDIDINYYVKVNFTTVIDLVNAMGGIKVYADEPVRIYTGRYLKKGYNKLNGEETLAFARERHAYADGDNHRGRNQQEVINAIFKQVTSGGAILTEYTKLLEAMDGKFATSMDMSEVMNFVKYELDDLANYEITSIQLKGSGDMGPTYSYPGQDLWIMIPNEKSIVTAKKQIATALGKETENKTEESQ